MTLLNLEWDNAGLWTRNSKVLYNEWAVAFSEKSSGARRDWESTEKGQLRQRDLDSRFARSVPLLSHKTH